MSLDLTEPSQQHDGRLLTLLNRQKFLIDQLGEFASRQDAAVRSEDAESLLELLGQRQELIDRILKAQREITPLLPQVAVDPKSKQELSSGERHEAATLIEAIESGLAEVMKRDDEARRMIQAIQDRARADMKSFGKTQQARRAYVPQRSGSVDARFSDRKG